MGWIWLHIAGAAAAIAAAWRLLNVLLPPIGRQLTRAARRF